MQNNKSEHNPEDSWSQLLSDFGLEDAPPTQAKAAPAAEPASGDAPADVPPVKRKGRPRSAAAEPAAPPKQVPQKQVPPEPTPREPKVEDESDPPKEKKSFFSRFPKISFFGAPPQPSLDAVVEGSKSPSLGGRSFTDNKLEKTPVERQEGRRGGQRSGQREEHGHGQPAADPFSAVASQIDSLATNDGYARRSVPSMFDEPNPVPEALRKVKDMLGDQPEGGGDREERRPYADSAPRGRGSRYQTAERREESPEENYEFEAVTGDDDDDFSSRRPQRGRNDSRRGGDREDRGGRGGRGGYSDNRRGGRYNEPSNDRPAEPEMPREEWSEVDEALQASHRPSRRLPQRSEQRYDQEPRAERSARPSRTERPERMNRDAMEDSAQDSGISSEIIHHDVPSWEEAVDGVISSNIARHHEHGHNHGFGRGQGQGRGNAQRPRQPQRQQGRRPRDSRD